MKIYDVMQYFLSSLIWFMVILLVVGIWYPSDSHLWLKLLQTSFIITVMGFMFWSAMEDEED